MKRIKILGLTSIRSDYDLLSPLYTLLHKDADIDFQLLVSGAHLSKSFGYSKQAIINDGFNILLEIESLINADSNKSRLKSASIFLQNSIDIVDKFQPDVILYAGDREDVIMGGLLGLYLNIPTIHFYGGDHEQDGHQDTYIRHATSKLSTLHFVCTLEHQKRLLSMGESAHRIFNIGSISLDRLLHYTPVDTTSFFKLNMPKTYALVIFHPLQGVDNRHIFENILSALAHKHIFAVVSYPNSDPGYNDILNSINAHQNATNCQFYTNLERDLFLTLFANCEFIIGNSSAGIYEAASFKKAAINVGSRQSNRFCANNVIFTQDTLNDIQQAIDSVYSHEFIMQLKYIQNPYGDGHSADKAYHLIKTLNLKDYLLKDEDPLQHFVENLAPIN